MNHLFAGYLQLALALSAVCVLLVPGCARPPVLPAIPAVDTSTQSAAAKEAILAAWEAAVASPNDAEATGVYGMVLHAHKFWEPALECYHRASLLDPGRLQWLHIKASLLFGRERYADAVEPLRIVIAGSLSALPLRLKLADSLLALQRYEEAEAEYKEILGRFPRSPRAYYGLGRIQADQGSWHEAERNYQTAILHYPRYGSAHYALATVQQQLGKKEEARQSLQLSRQYEGQRPDPQDPVLVQVLEYTTDPQSISAHGAHLLRNGRTEAAIAEFEKALGYEPDFFHALVNLGIAHRELDHFEISQDYFRRALRIKSDLPEPHYYYYRLLSSHGKYRQAAAVISDALSLKPDDPTYLAAHGECLEELGRLREAKDRYRQALELDPGCEPARSRLGCLLSLEGRNGEAVRWLEHARPQEARQKALNNLHLGRSYYRLGDPERALTILRVAHFHAKSAGDDPLADSIGKEIERISPGAEIM